MIHAAAFLAIALIQDHALTDEHSAAVAKMIQETKKSGDFAKFDAACDLDAHAARVFGKAKLSEPMRRLLMSFIRGDEIVGPTNVLRTSVAMGRDLKFLRTRTVDGAPRPLFRAVDDLGNYGYVEWVLSMSPEKSPRIVDAYLFTTGELASVSLARFVMPHPDALEVLNTLKAPTVGDLMHSNQEFFDLLKLEQEGKAEKVLEHFDKHRRAFRRHKSAHLLRMRVAMRVGKEARLKAFSEFEAALPKDPSLLYQRIGPLWQDGKHDEALEAVNALDKEVGGDPFLHAVRASLHLDAGRPDRAEELSGRCTDEEPALAEGWYVRVALRLRLKDADGALKLVREGDKAASLEIKRLEELPGFEVLKESAEYAKWKATRTSK